LATGEVIIECGRSEKNYWRDLWRYRELYQVLTWRDCAVRYKQTVLGVGWAVIRPVLAMLIFTVIFGRIAKLPSDGAPYSLMVFAGMLPWTFFATGLSEASNSLIANTALVSKVYFPRIIMPTATITAAFVDFFIGLFILAIMMTWYQVVPSWRILLLPVFVLLAFLAALGPSLWVTAVNVKYRDFRYVIPFLVQFGLYVSPVGFTSSVVPHKWRLLYSLNPLVGIIDAFRWCVLRSSTDWSGVGISVAVVVVLLWLGIRQFRKLEKSFADLI
jgi:lipopolysaccharide transport system permease protein